MREHETHWLMDFPLINNLKNNYSDLKKPNKQVLYEENFIILQSIEIVVIKVRKQGWSPTPADIQMGI